MLLTPASESPGAHLNWPFRSKSKIKEHCLQLSPDTLFSLPDLKDSQLTLAHSLPGFPRLYSPKVPTRVILCVRVLCWRLCGGRQLCQLEVILPLFPHPVRIGAAGVPLDPDPSVLSKFTNHTAKTRRRSILRKPKQRSVKRAHVCSVTQSL